MSWKGHSPLRRKRAQRFRSQKKEHDDRVLLEELRQQLEARLSLLGSRHASLEEGREIISLSRRLKRLERKVGGYNARDTTHITKDLDDLASVQER